MLTRTAIRSGAYLDCLNTLPEGTLWSVERIEASLAATLQVQPTGTDLWVFAYGSLMWNPLLDAAEQQVATLAGWHRSFCLDITAGRASPERPGRMLALEPGGATQGIALRLDPATAQEELRLLWIREMVMGSYRPLWAPVTLMDGTTVPAIVFVADPAHPHYATDTSVATVAPLVAGASGCFGGNADYVLSLAATLAAHGLVDDHIAALAVELSRLTPLKVA
jgi:cation transport protein ChaC